MVMLQLVDQVVAVKNVGASLGLTGSPRARGREVRRRHTEEEEKRRAYKTAGRTESGLRIRTTQNTFS